MKEISLGEEAKDCPAFPYTEGQLGLSKVVIQIYNWQGKNEMLKIFFFNIYIFYNPSSNDNWQYSPIKYKYHVFKCCHLSARMVTIFM